MPNDGDVVLLVGTMKGAFLLRADGARKKWRLEGPHFQGFAVYAMLHDGRTARNRTYAAANNPFFEGAMSDQLALIPFVLITVFLYLVGRERLLAARKT